MSGLEKFPARLARAREIRGFTARELDRRAGLSLGQISKVESGRRATAEIDTVVRAAAALDVSLDWLVLGVGPGPNASPDAFPASLRAALEARSSVSRHTVESLQKWFDELEMKDRPIEHWSALVDVLEEEAAVERLRAIDALEQLQRRVTRRLTKKNGARKQRDP